MKKIIIILLLITTNLQAVEITGFLEAKISENGLLVGPTILVTEGDLFYQMTMYTAMDIFNPYIDLFKLSGVEYGAIFGIKLSKEFTVIFRENYKNSINTIEYNNKIANLYKTVNFQEFTLRKTNYNSKNNIYEFLDSMK